jgi:hypothetical protein
MQILIPSEVSDELKVGGATPGPRNKSCGLLILTDQEV